MTDEDAVRECEALRHDDPRDKRIAELDADLRETLRAVLHHFGPDGAHKVTTTVLEQRGKAA